MIELAAGGGFLIVTAPARRRPADDAADLHRPLQRLAFPADHPGGGLLLPEAAPAATGHSLARALAAGAGRSAGQFAFPAVQTEHPPAPAVAAPRLARTSGNAAGAAPRQQR